MAGASLFTLLDDIATLLDDVAVLTKLAAKKTAGVLGDDLALNAQQVTGMSAARELPVVWGVAKGSLLNKVILVPAALAISALEAWLRTQGWDVPIIITLLLVGGGFLCFEGMEKVVHHFFHRDEPDAAMARQAELLVQQAAGVDLVALERDKIRGAIRTDFILSAEVIVLTLGIVAGAELSTQVITLSSIAVAMTVVVYGLVAGIVKIDDLGLWLSQKRSALLAVAGRSLVRAAPWLMRVLSVVGVVAMFLVGGGIVVHNIPAVHHVLATVVPASGGLAGPANLLASLLIGMLVGSVILGVVTGLAALRRKPRMS